MSDHSWLTRAETPADVAAIRDVTEQAFGKQYEADIIDALRADPEAWLPDLSYVATTGDGRVVAHALLSRCHIGSINTPALSLGPVAVLPEFQRQGAGAAAIRAALEAARAAGEHAVVLLGHLEYYPRFGFRPAAAYGIKATFGDGPNLMALGLQPGRPLPSGLIQYPPGWNV